jgi:hypothetical protein
MNDDLDRWHLPEIEQHLAVAAPCQPRRRARQK